MAQQLELGLDTFGDVTRGTDGNPVPYPQVIRDVIDEAVLADAVGVDSFGIGEHHRSDFAVSSPEMMLATIAGQTSRIHLGSAVTVLSSDDPIRVYQRFSTLNALSNGRAEVIVGRGSFTESFPLFGFELAQYNTLFEERLEPFAAILTERAGTWSGATPYRAPRAAGVSTNRGRPSTNLGRCRRQSRLGGPRGAPQPAAHAGNYRRQ